MNNMDTDKYLTQGRDELETTQHFSTISRIVTESNIFDIIPPNSHGIEAIPQKENGSNSENIMALIQLPSKERFVFLVNYQRQ
jgi:hypothetical protein